MKKTLISNFRSVFIARLISCLVCLIFMNGLTASKVDLPNTDIDKQLDYTNSDNNSNFLKDLIRMRKRIANKNSNNEEDSEVIQKDSENSSFKDFLVNDLVQSNNGLGRRRPNSIRRIFSNLKHDDSEEYTSKSKRGFQIQTYYDALVQSDGSIILIPKDVNKNHYFIG